MTTNPVEPQLIWSGSLPMSAPQGGAGDSADLRLYTYTEKSVALTTGESFGKLYSHALKTLGSFNPRLKVGPGWIFSRAKYSDLQTLITNITTGQIQPQASGYNKSPQTAAPNSAPRLLLRSSGGTPSPNLPNPGLYHSANYDITGQTIPPPPGVRQNVSPEPSVNQLLSVLLHRVGATNGTFETASPDRRYQRITLWGSKVEIDKQVSDYQSRRAIEVARFVTPDRMALVLDLPNPDLNPEPTSPSLRLRPASPPPIHSPSRPASPSPPVVRTPSSPPRIHSPPRSSSPSPPVIRTPSSPRGNLPITRVDSGQILGITNEINQLSIMGNPPPTGRLAERADDPTIPSLAERGGFTGGMSYVSEEGSLTWSQLRDRTV